MERGFRSMNQFLSGVVPRVADFCFVFRAHGSAIRCVACAHRSRDGQRLVRAFARAYHLTRNDPVSTVAHVIRTGRPKLRAEIRPEASVPLIDLRVFALHRALGARSALVVPIGAAPNVIGALSLAYSDSRRRYTWEDVAAARRLAATSAVFLQRPLASRRPLRLRARV